MTMQFSYFIIFVMGLAVGSILITLFNSHTDNEKLELKLLNNNLLEEIMILRQSLKHSEWSYRPKQEDIP